MTIIKKLLLFLVVIALPLFILMTSIRVFLSTIWLEFEYKCLNLPPDPYGMTTSQRIDYSKKTMGFLMGWSSLEELKRTAHDDGEIFFNDREISHLIDVKILIQIMIISWVLIGSFLVGMRFAFWRWKMQKDFWRSIKTGGWAAVGLLIAIIISVVVNFDALFTKFHEVFFTGETWLFYTSDSLIRMFPMEFFANYFIAVGVCATLLGILFGLLGYKYSKSVS